ncbi:uromodulin-like [Orbicella faveolata]|uniref:uromodulin-like n=2 Tax=Orbicella faveolata TaxID=48498 RepID=UPI0009E64589|nr:uromodulin-like [Orbicella faveolata]
MVTQEMVLFVQISTNADRTTSRQSTVTSRTTVMLMLTVPTLKDHSTVRVLMVILVMEWLVNLFLSFSDIEECEKEIDNCHVDANCTNTRGSFSCTCHTGYSGDGVMCDDIEECFPGQISDEYLQLAHDCHADANCTNTKGSFYCTCHTGYSGDGNTCVDVDECFPDRISDEYLHLAHNCHVDANCTNTEGSFHCTCHTGYSGDGVVCLDINECDPSGLSSEYQHLAHICHDDANCTNTKGSYHCACLKGYSGSGEHCTGRVTRLHF